MGILESLPTAWRIVGSTRVACYCKSNTLSSRGQCPDLSPEGDFVYLRVLVLGCTVKCLSHYTQVSCQRLSGVQRTFTACVAALRESTRYVASRTHAHNPTHESVIKLLMYILTYLTNSFKKKQDPPTSHKLKHGVLAGRVITL